MPLCWIDRRQLNCTHSGGGGGGGVSGGSGSGVCGGRDAGCDGGGDAAAHARKIDSVGIFPADAGVDTSE